MDSADDVYWGERGWGQVPRDMPVEVYSRSLSLSLCPTRSCHGHMFSHHNPGTRVRTTAETFETENHNKSSLRLFSSGTLLQKQTAV